MNGTYAEKHMTWFGVRPCFDTDPTNLCPECKAHQAKFESPRPKMPLPDEHIGHVVRWNQ